MERLTVSDFTATVEQFIKHNNLEEMAAKSSSGFNRIIYVVAESLEDEGFEFSASCSKFIRSIHSIQNKAIKNIAHSKLKELL